MRVLPTPVAKLIIFRFEAIIDGKFVKGDLRQKEENFETIEEYTKGKPPTKKSF